MSSKQVHDLCGAVLVESSSDILHLFERSFGYAMSPELWSWKYKDKRGQHFGVWDGARLVAHYGGMTRHVSMFGQSCLACQIGDVMVDPKYRGVGGRKGPFFQAMAGYSENFCGYDKMHLIGYGFPTSHAMRLGVLLRQYEQIDRISELTWTPQSSKGLRGQILNRAALVKSAKVIDNLWQLMAQTMMDAVLTVRDLEYLLYRYFDHPTRKYQVYLVKKGWFGRKVGLVVLQQGEEDIELMDIMGHPDDFPSLIDFSKSQAKEWGGARLKAWGSTKVTQYLSGADRVYLDVYVPACIWTPGPSPEELRGKWWLMLGDTDFR